jgi:hypothetical protein
VALSVRRAGCLGAYGQGVVEDVVRVPPRLDLLESGVVVPVVHGVPRDARGVPFRIGEVDVRMVDERTAADFRRMGTPPVSAKMSR